MRHTDTSIHQHGYGERQTVGLVTDFGRRRLFDVARAYGLGNALNCAGAFSFTSFLDRIAELKERRSFTPPNLVLAGAENEDALLAIAKASDHGLVRNVALIGHLGEIERKVNGADVLRRANVKVIPTDVNSAGPEKEKKLIGVFRQFVRNNPDYIVMKGTLDTGTVLRGALPMYRKDPISSSTEDPSTGHLASFTGLFVLPGGRLIALSDPAVNPAFRDAKTLVRAIANMLDVVRRVSDSGRVLKVAIVTAIEKETSAVPATVLAAETVIASRALHARYGPLVVEGPLSLDLAMVPEVAAKKRYAGEILGDADCLVATDINTANVLYKMFSKILGSFDVSVDYGGIVTAGPETTPIALTSRADGSRTKFNSILLAIAYSSVSSYCGRELGSYISSFSS